MRNRKTESTAWALCVAASALFSAGASAGPVEDLQPGQWYEFPDSAIRDVLPSPVPAGNAYSMVYYSGGAFDTRRNRLMVWGGGHAAYAGNELYAFDVPSGRWSRLTSPTATPISVHTYDQLEYLPRQDLFFAAGGSIWGDGDASRETWLFDPTTNAWRQGQNIVGNLMSVWEYNMTTAYDPATDQVLMAGYVASAGYNGATNTWTPHNNSVRRDLGTTGALDTRRRVFLTVGRSTANTHTVSSSGVLGAKTALNATGATDIQACDAPGLEYDPVADRFVAWCSGSDVYSLNMDTRVWTRHTATNGVSPGDPRVQNTGYRGTFGRWRYMPAYNAFVLYTLVDHNVFVYKLTNGTGTAPAAPSVSIAASPASVASGGSTTLTWSSANATACSASGGWSGARATSGQASVGPLSAGTTFSMTCTGSNGSATNAVAVVVQAPTTGGGGTGGTGGTTGGGSGGGTTGSSNANEDWASRSNGPGVVRAVGFDVETDWSRYSTPVGRANSWDTNVRASGAGSVRFDIRSQTGQGGVGNLAINFSEDLQTQFGPGEEFWVQWRQRFDDYVISHNYAETGGSGEWKQVIIAQGDRRLGNGSVLQGYACSENQIVVGNAGARDYANGYIECGKYLPFEDYIAGTGYIRQNGRVDGAGNPTCVSYPSGQNTSGCLWYVPNEWMTFMVHVRLGQMGVARSSVANSEQPGMVDSLYELYIARQGQPFQLAHRQDGLVVPRGQHWNASSGVNPDNVNDPGYGGNGWTAHDAHPQAEFGKIWLTPFHTNKDATEVTENASIWYDELIISAQPIAAPGGSAAPATASVSLSASATSVNAGGSATLTWSSQNVSSCTASGGWTGSRTTSGQQAVGPLSATTTYTLSCTGTSGSVSRSVTVNVASGTGGGSTGGGSTGGGSATYSLLYDPTGHANGLPLDDATVSGQGWVFVTPETGVSRVEFFVNGQTWHTEVSAPYDIQGSTIFSFDQLRDGANTVTANITTTDGQTVAVNATFQAGSGSSGGSGGGTTSNQAPATPAVLGPAGPVALDDARLDTATYFDPEGDDLLASHWEISRDQAFENPVLEKRVDGRTALVLSAGILDPSSDYWVRSRHQDSRGSLSAWSQAVMFSTAATLPGDANANGIDDGSEVVGFADTNGNGTNDVEEGICNLATGSGSGIVGLESASGNVRCYRTVAVADAPAPPAAEMQFPFGLFSFRIDGLRVDPVEPARVTMRVHLPERPSGSVKWYKLDPATGVLFELASSVTFDGNTALVELVDGGIGDFDGVVNGVIVDPSGPLTIPSSGGTGGGSTGGGGGGSLGILLSALMAWAGLARRRAQR